MPHNLYLHSGLVLSRKVNRASPHRVHDAIWYARIEAAVALLFSFFINLAVVATNADKFFAPACAEAAAGPYACIDAEAYAMGLGGGSAASGAAPPAVALSGRGAPCVVNRSSALPSHGVCAELGLTTEGYALSAALVSHLRAAERMRATTQPSSTPTTAWLRLSLRPPSRVPPRVHPRMRAQGPGALYVWAFGLFAAGQAATMVCTYAGQIIMGGCLELHLGAHKPQGSHGPPRQRHPPCCRWSVVDPGAGLEPFGDYPAGTV